jgi:hypothetical protein
MVVTNLFVFLKSENNIISLYYEVLAQTVDLLVWT